MFIQAIVFFPLGSAALIAQACWARIIGHRTSEYMHHRAADSA